MGLRGTLQLAVAFEDMMLSGFREEKWYPLWLISSLTEVQQRVNEPTVIFTDLAPYPGDLSYLYYVADRAYIARDVSAETYIREQRNILGTWNKIEVYSKKTVDRARYYCGLSG